MRRRPHFVGQRGQHSLHRRRDSLASFFTYLMGILGFAQIRARRIQVNRIVKQVGAMLSYLVCGQLASRGQLASARIGPVASLAEPRNRGLSWGQLTIWH